MAYDQKSDGTHPLLSERPDPHPAHRALEAHNLGQPTIEKRFEQVTGASP
ncbi:MAG: hypothetical protein HS109_07010 [Burkholderiales bacterium]|nr:hypothetical protein [Burkholderiales bacterium]